MKRYLLQDHTGSWFPLIDMPCRWGHIYANGSTRFFTPFARGTTELWAARLAMRVLCEAIIFVTPRVWNALVPQIKQALGLGE